MVTKVGSNECSERQCTHIYSCLSERLPGTLAMYHLYELHVGIMCLWQLPRRCEVLEDYAGHPRDQPVIHICVLCAIGFASSSSDYWNMQSIGPFTRRCQMKIPQSTSILLFECENVR